MKIFVNRWLVLFFVLIVFCAGFFFGHYYSSLCNRVIQITERIKVKFNTHNTDLSDVPVFKISIPEKSFEKLKQKRDEALKSGFLIKDDDDFTAAEIKYKNNSFPIKIRLKGDWADHFKTDKWSLRIKSESPIMGMKKISLQHPMTREYLSEWFFHKALQHEGFISLQYFFVKVEINGQDNGLYALEEFFDDDMLKANGCEPAPIIKLSEENIWTEMAQYVDSGISKGDMYNNFLFQSIDKTNIDAFNLDKIIKDSTSYSQLKCGKDLFYNFLDSVLPASKVFDVDKSSRLLALIELLEAEHSVHWNNLRFYFNPNTKLLEPISFDADINRHYETLTKNFFQNGYHDQKYIRLLLGDSIFTKKYMYWLNYYTQSNFLNDLQLSLKDSIQRNLDILHTEWPEVQLPTEIWEENRKLIQLSLHPPTVFYAYFKKVSNEKIEIEIDNITGLPVEITGLQINDSTLIPPLNKTILLRYPQRTTILFQTNQLINKSANQLIRFHLLGFNEILTQKIIPFSRSTESAISKQ